MYVGSCVLVWLLFPETSIPPCLHFIIFLQWCHWIMLPLCWASPIPHSKKTSQRARIIFLTTQVLDISEVMQEHVIYCKYIFNLHSKILKFYLNMLQVSFSSSFCCYKLSFPLNNGHFCITSDSFCCLRYWNIARLCVLVLHLLTLIYIYDTGGNLDLGRLTFLANENSFQQNME